MKQKIYAISLLLSFLAVLLHDMIPHHHHEMEEYVYDVSFQSHVYKNDIHSHGTYHHHHGEGEHDHGEEKDSENSHSNNFPLHHHHSVHKEFDYFKSNLKRFLNSGLNLVAVLFSINTFELSLPPEIDFIRFTDKPFLINSTFEPGATGLRAPPSIA